MAIATCLNCQKEFTYGKSTLPRKYCCRECMKLAAGNGNRVIFVRQVRVGFKPNDPMNYKRTPAKTLTCTHCKKEFTSTRKGMIYPKYCSQQCVKDSGASSLEKATKAHERWSHYRGKERAMSNLPDNSNHFRPSSGRGRSRA